MMNSNEMEHVMSSDPADARRHCGSGPHGVKCATGHIVVAHQAGYGNRTTGDAKHFIALRSVLRVAPWNVRGMLQVGKLDVIEKEMERCGVEIMGISESHWRGCGHITTDRGNTVYFSGQDNSSRNGVAFIIPRRLNNAVLSYTTVSDRIITIKMNSKPCLLNIIQVYAPTSASPEEEIESFYAQLTVTLKEIPKKEITILQGDLNAKVGTTRGDHLCGSVVGGYGLGNRNERGERFLNFCIENQLTVMNTWFQHHPRRLYIWNSPGNRHRNQIDYITINTRWRSTVANVKCYPGADCGSDHQLMIANIRLRLKNTLKPNHKKSLNLEDTALMRFSELMDQKIPTLNQDYFESANNTWQTLKMATINTARELQASTTGQYRRREWISDDTWELITQRRQIKEAGINHSSVNKAKYKSLHKKVKKACRRDKNAHIENICKEIDQYSSNIHTKDLFKKVKLLTAKRKPKTWMIEGENGVVISDRIQVVDRWRKYCSDLYTNTGQQDSPRMDDDFVREPDILLAEVEHAISRLKNKAVGGDGIAANLIKNFGKEGTQLLHTICQKIWRTGQWPDDWTESIVIPLHKKGSTKKCENFRTISLLSHASKIMLDIINKRLSAFTDWQIADEQAGFVTGKGTREQIMNVRLLIEKCREFNVPAVFCFIDYAKAFDCVNWSALIRVLLEMGVPHHLAFLIQNLYLEGSSRVKIEDDLSEPFKAERGVRQGCILSPKLFNIYGEYIMRKALENWHGGIAVGGRMINNLRFADDTTLVTSSVPELVELLERVETESVQLGLHINRSKTKVMLIDRPGVLTEVEQLQDLEVVHEFVYLGSLINDVGTCEAEIRRRIQMAKGAMTSLERVWKSRNIGKAIKIRLVKTLIFSIFMYGAETWMTRARDRARIDAFEMWCWRRLLRIPWTEHRTNISILAELDIEVRLSAVCMRRVLQYFGHVARRGADNLEKLFITGKVQGTRSRGRAPMRWSDQVKTATGLTLQEALRRAEDRVLWRETVQAVVVGHDPQQ